jgi:hypothetical protein
MLCRGSLPALALLAALGIAIVDARAFDDATYPDWSGAWRGIGGGSFDPSKPKGLGQQTPLKPEFQAILEASIADIATGGQGNDPGYRCASHGMPRVMIANVPIYFVIMPETTYVILERLSQVRRVYTDGRAWPAQLPRSSVGYSIGRWLPDDGSGRFATLEVETRGMNGARVYDSSGAPFHPDNATALTRPWTVTRTYRRTQNPVWHEYTCAVSNQHIVIGRDDYLLSADGLLMPVKKGQSPPDLRYFDQPQK